MKVPRCKQSFLKDQRTARKMDKKASGGRHRRIERESQFQERQQNRKLRRLEREQVLAPGDLSVPYIQGSASIESGDDDLKIEVLEDRNLTPFSHCRFGG